VTRFNGPVTAAALATDAPGATQVNGGAVTTTGPQFFGDPVSIGFATTFRAGGNVTFASSLGGPFAATLLTTADGAFNGPVDVATLRTDAGGRTLVNTPTVTATGDLFFDDAVLISVGTTLTSRAGGITFNAPVGPAAAGLGLTLAAPGGPILVNAAVGGTTRFASIDLTAGSIALAAGLGADGDIRLTANKDGVLTANKGGVNQTAGVIAANNLALVGSGPFALDAFGDATTANDIGGNLRIDTAGGKVNFASRKTITATDLANANGDIALRTAGGFKLVDPRTGADRYSTPLVRIGTGKLTVDLTSPNGATVDFDAEATAGLITFGRDKGGNSGADTFNVRPSATTPITVYGNDPTNDNRMSSTGDTLYPKLDGVTVTNFQYDGQDGFYDFAGRERLTFLSIESLNQLALTAFVVQTGEPRDGAGGQVLQYAVRVARTQDGTTLGGGLSGTGLAQNPFVVSPALVNPLSPGSSPRLAFGSVTKLGNALVLAAGPGSPPLVTVIDANVLNAKIAPDGKSSTLVDLANIDPSLILAQFYVYGLDYLGGVNLAVGDLDGDGVAEIVTGADLGGGAHVRTFKLNATDNPRKFTAVQADGPLASFFAFEPSFRGGVRVAIDPARGGQPGKLIVGAGIGGGPRVRVLDGVTGAVAADFFAYETSFRGGVQVASGLFNGDSVPDILTAPGQGGGARVRVFSGANLPAVPEPASLFDFLAFPATDPTTGQGYDPLFGAASPATGSIGGIAFGAGTSAGSRTILVSAPRGPRVDVVEFTRVPGTDALTRRSLLDPVVAGPLGIQPVSPPPSLLNYGATVAGYFDNGAGG
jgi:hypothetical protein